MGMQVSTIVAYCNFRIGTPIFGAIQLLSRLARCDLALGVGLEASAQPQRSGHVDTSRTYLHGT